MPTVIPLHLRLAGFLSYRDPVELDFTGFDLACVSGPNGAGKSTLLDAITWALFGQARRRDDALINQQSEAAEVAFTFHYEGTDYRVQRSLRRGKPGVLEFQARNGTDSSWRTLTERTQRDTQSRIEQILRLDFDTFVNASFFLQGKADLFAQQPPARRKEVLANILGMELWDVYKARTAELRRGRESELSALTARLTEIDAELAEEPQRRAALENLESELQRASAERKARLSTLEAARRLHEVLDRQRALLAEQRAALQRLQSDMAGLQARLEDRKQARLVNIDLTGKAVEIEAAFAAWRSARAELTRLDEVSRNFADRERQRLPLLQEIAAEQARLTQERSQLAARQEQAAGHAAEIATLQDELRRANDQLSRLEQELQRRTNLQEELAELSEEVAGRSAENRALKEKMDDLKARIDALDAAEGASCPLCGQALTPAHRKSTLAAMKAEGKQYGDQYRRNNNEVNKLREKRTEIEASLQQTGGYAERRLAQSGVVAQLAERLSRTQAELQAWESDGRVRLEQVQRLLSTGKFAGDARSQLAKVDAELAGLGYDAAAHDKIRRNEAELRSVEDTHSRLLQARAALAPLEDEVRSIEQQLTARSKESSAQEAAVQQMEADLHSTGGELPDLREAENALFQSQERENLLNQEVGAARQKVAVLDDLRRRSKEFGSARQDLAVSIGRHKALESALGKDGVQALLIEQALPELESRANDILDRLSDGRMSVHFETQAAYRDRKREDLKETLEIRISDGAGQREYEMYSGGEAFRVNFAIRLALSQVLAGRKGARLQTLVIDEGFGSQDNQGRQRLIETINLVRHDFAKILLISHLDELKDAFPTRIEVEKTERGSTLRVT